MQGNPILGATTATSNVDFTDLNGDSCSVAGTDPDHTKHCTSDIHRPCTRNIQCSNAGAGTCVDGPIIGTTFTGPCCAIGQTGTLVATGATFSGSAPLFDFSYVFMLPTSVSSCGVASAPDYTSTTTNACEQ